MKGLFRRTWRHLALGAGFGVFAYLVAMLGVSTIIGSFERIGPRFFLMPAMAVFGLCVRGLSILPLMPPGQRLSVPAAIASRLAATALNIVLPAFGIGGEAIRLLWVPLGRRERMGAAIILDRSLLILADLAFLLLAAIAGLWGLALPGQLQWLAIASALAAVAGAAAIGWVSARRGLSVPFVKALRSAGFRSMGGKLQHAEAVDATIRALWRERPRCVLYSGAIQFASRLFLAAEILVGLWLLEVPTSPLEGLVVSSTPIGVNAVFAFVPNQLGVQEAGIALVFGALDLGARTGVVLGVIQRMSQLVQVPVGLLALAAAPRPRAKRPSDHTAHP